MGMTDKQFNSYVRLLLNDIEEANEQELIEEVKKKLDKIIENLQLTLEN